MKVELVRNKDLRVTPETEFEKEWLVQNYRDMDIRGFIKTGMDLTDIQGLQVIAKDPDGTV